MNDNLKSEQDEFWAGEFGTEYVDRNAPFSGLVRRIAHFSKILPFTRGVNSILELGAGIGTNLDALHAILPDAKFSGVEINEKAFARLAAKDFVSAYHDSILNISLDAIGTHDLTFTAGVLIHIDPKHLSEAYKKLYDASRRYILVAEYYSPTPVEIEYRGHRNKLFKRDFAGDLLDQYSDLKLVTYGFRYHRDPIFPSDDISWFLMEKE